MRVERIAFTDFRNLENAEIFPHPGTNLIAGVNGQGKTNLIEGIWLLCGQRSFRQAKEAETVAFSKKRAVIEADIFSGERVNRFSLTLTSRRSACLNGIHVDKISALGEKFAAVVFSPIHIELIREAPEARRAFLDSAVLSTKPAFAAVLREYDGVLYQRNTLLKRLQAGYSSELADTLEAYTKRLAQIGARVYAARSRYTARLCEEAPLIYENISGGEKLEIVYKCSVEGGEHYGEALYDALRRGVDEDIRNGFTGVGPHREDMELILNGQKARQFASQGQSKSVALCLKLAEGRILERAIGQKPVFLLDDVMSELDKNRQNYILENLGENQLFITGCDCAALSRRLPKGAVFTVKSGVVHKRGDKTKKCICTSETTSMLKPQKSSESST